MTKQSDSIPDLMVVSDGSTTESLDFLPHQPMVDGLINDDMNNNASVTDIHRNFSNRRLRLQRTVSAPSIPLNLQTKQPEPLSVPLPVRLSKFIQESRPEVSHHIDAEDSTIEESWRPNPIERIQKNLPDATKSPSKSHPTTTSLKSSLEQYVDSLVSSTMENNADSQDYISRKGETGHQKPIDMIPPVATTTVASIGNRSLSQGRPRRKLSRSSDVQSRTSSITSSSRSTKRSPKKEINLTAQTRKDPEVPRKNHDLVERPARQPPSMDGQLSTFLHRELRNKPTTSAQSNNGDPQVSIAISSVDGAKMFTVGPKEAQLIQQILEANSANGSSFSRHESCLLPEHDLIPPQSAHEASTIAESERISTRSSLNVEVSPPSTKYNSLTHYLSEKRGRRKLKSTAFTVAGDKVSVRFQGKSTSELLEILKEEQHNFCRKIRPIKSGAIHHRSDLERMALAPDLNTMNAMHESISFFGPPFLESPRNTSNSKTLKATREDVQSFLDGRSPNSRRRLSRSHSVSGDSMSNNKRRISREKARFVSQELVEFSPPIRPTNRRTLMRKMHSVPLLMDESPTYATSKQRGSRQRSTSGGDGRSSSQDHHQSRRENRQHRSRSRTRKGLRSESLDQSRHDGSRSPRSLARSESMRRGRKKKDLSISNRTKDEDQGNKLDELDVQDLHKSFLDQFLDHDIEIQDSASQINVPKDEYKSSLREIPQDPKKVRPSDFKRVKTELEHPSPRLALLYVSSQRDTKIGQDTTQERKGDTIFPIQDCDTKSEAKMLSSRDKKKLSTKSPKPKSSRDIIEPFHQKSQMSNLQGNTFVETIVAATIEPSPLGDRLTLKDLPRQRIEKTIDIPDTSGHVRLTNRIKMLSKNKNTVNFTDDTPPRKIVKSPVPTNEEVSCPPASELSSEISSWTKKGISRPPLSNDPVASSATDTKSTPITLPAQRCSHSSRQGLSLKGVAATNRLSSVTVAEGAVLEIFDDMSVCSDITDGFSREPHLIDLSKRTGKQELGQIQEDESSAHVHRMIGGTSWADLSLSNDTRDETSRDKRMHLSKRWQSTPSLGGARQFDVLKSPIRDVEGMTETTTPGRLGWLKKKMGLTKSKKPLSSKT